MHKVIIDTSVIVSFLLGSSACFDVVYKCLFTDIFKTCLSNETFDELKQKLSQPKFTGKFKFTQLEIDKFLKVYCTNSTIVEPKTKVIFERDPIGRQIFRIS